METEWKMLIKSVGEGCIMVEIFLMKGSSWSRLSDLLVSLELAILADCPAVPVLPPMPEVTGERLAVSVCQQEATLTLATLQSLLTSTFVTSLPTASREN